MRGVKLVGKHHMDMVSSGTSAIKENRKMVMVVIGEQLREKQALAKEMLQEATALSDGDGDGMSIGSTTSSSVLFMEQDPVELHHTKLLEHSQMILSFTSITKL